MQRNKPNIFKLPPKNMVHRRGSEPFTIWRNDLIYDVDVGCMSPQLPGRCVTSVRASTNSKMKELKKDKFDKYFPSSLTNSDERPELS